MLAAISRRETIEGFTRELEAGAALRSAAGGEAAARGPAARAVRGSPAPLLPHRVLQRGGQPAAAARAVAGRPEGPLRQGVEALVAEGVRRGVFRDVPPRLVVFGMLGMLNWLYKWYNPAGRWGAEEISAAFLSVLEWWLLRARPRGAALTRRLRRARDELASLARALDA